MVYMIKGRLRLNLDNSELSTHFEGIDTLIDRFEKLLIRRIRFSKDYSILNLVLFLEKSWQVICHISVQVSSSNAIRYIYTFTDVENAFIEKLLKEIGGLGEINSAFYRKLELMKGPLAHVLDFYKYI